MSNIIDEPNLQVFGLVTTQGTAMAETAFCENHVEKHKAEALKAAHCAGDADPAYAILNVSQNDMMFCGFCGMNGYSEDNSYQEID